VEGWVADRAAGARREEGTPRMRRIKAVIQYDGTGFSGFQRQKGQRTVQEVLEVALGELLGRPVTVRGAGRTDAGVHARGQVVSFTTRGTVPAENIPRAISGFLPKDVLVSRAEDVPLNFDPLRDAVQKTYCYRVWRSEEPDVFWERYCHRHSGGVDFDLLSAETRPLLGKHDFLSFRAAGSSVRTTVREVREARWVRRDADGVPDVLWEFWVSADGFLYRMVRMMVGTLLDVARGFLPPGTVAEALARPGHVRVGQCAPGKGLCLEEVSFS